MRLGRYMLLKRVGSGGMAEVWKAVFHGPAGFEKDVAIKRILPHLAADRELMGMFVGEAKLVARLAHPNIVQVFDFGVAEAAEDDGLGEEYFLALEYVDGQNLSNLAKRLRDAKRTLPFYLAQFIASEAAKGLAFAHSAIGARGEALEIVHSDVSPHNILVSYNGEVKVTDFGIARVGTNRPNTDGELRGKVSFFSPEQASFLPIDRRSDIFSLGLVLYELVTGERLFQGTVGDEIVERIRSFTGLDAAQLDGLPQGVRDVLARALRPAPSDRYADAGQMETELAYALGPGGVTAARTELAALLQDLFIEERSIERASKPPEQYVEYVTGEHAAYVPSPAGESENAGGQDAVTSNWANGADISDKTATATRVRRRTNPSITMVSPSFLHDDAPPVDRVSAIAVAAASPAAPVAVPVATPVEPAAKAPRVSLSSIPAVGTMPSFKGKPSVQFAFRRPRRSTRLLAFALAAVVVAAAGLWIPKIVRRLRSAPVQSPTPIEVAIATGAESVDATPVPADPTATPAEIAAPTSTPPKPIATRRVAVAATPAPTRRPRATPVATAAMVGSDAGWLTVLADPWVEVWIDGKRAASETPMRRHPLAAGRHEVKVVNSGTGYNGEESVDIETGAESRLFVDVAQKRIRIEN